MSAPFVTIRSRALSMWQSTVNKVANTSKDLSPEQRELMKQAVDAHVTAVKKGQAIPMPAQISKPPTLQDHVALSADAFAGAMARKRAAAGATQLKSPSDVSLPSLPETPYVWKYSNEDYAGWYTCLEAYDDYYIFGAAPVYRDWTAPGFGKGNINYGVCSYTLPDKAKVLIVGDWGTGMSDAVTMLKAAVTFCNPQAIIHLGDVYYSGTSEEYGSNFASVFKTLFQGIGSTIPVFNIPGNHDYYSGGGAFYATVDEMNSNTSTSQVASYFCLRTQDMQWQFLAMDTGYNDHDPGNDFFDDTVEGPALVPSEVAWHVDKLKNFTGNTILLSHHQLFSGNAAINGSKTQYLPYLNEKLYTNFVPYFGKISAWLWGHEHSFAYYQDGLFGLNKGRLLGCSAYEEMQSDNPYTLNYAKAPFANNMAQVQLSPYKDQSGNQYYSHAFAVIDFDRPGGATDPIKITYYQFPSWGNGAPPPLPEPTVLYEETFATPEARPVWLWQGNTPISSTNVLTGTTGVVQSGLGACPALALFNGKLYMAYQDVYTVPGSTGIVNLIRLAWFDGSVWRDEFVQNMSGGVKGSSSGGVKAQSQVSPALAVCGGKLYLIFQQANQYAQNQLWVATFDGETWSAGAAITFNGKTVTSTDAPSAIGWKDRILLVFAQADPQTNHKYLYSAIFDATTGAWSGFGMISTDLVSSIQCNQPPKLAVFAPTVASGQPSPNGASVEPRICMSYLNSGAQTSPAEYCMAWFDGNVWTGGRQLASGFQAGIVHAVPIAAYCTPWLAQLGDKLMAITTDGHDNIMTSLFDGLTWSPAVKISDWTPQPTPPISPVTYRSGAAIPYGTGVFTVYFGEGSNSKTICQAHVDNIVLPSTS